MAVAAAQHDVIEKCTVTSCADQGILAAAPYIQIHGNYVDCVGGEVVGGSDGAAAADCFTIFTPAAGRPSTTTFRPRAERFLQPVALLGCHGPHPVLR